MASAGSPAEFLRDCAPDILLAAPRGHTIPTPRQTAAFGFISHFPIVSAPEDRSCGEGEVVARRTPRARDKYWKIGEGKFSGVGEAWERFRLPRPAGIELEAGERGEKSLQLTGEVPTY